MVWYSVVLIALVSTMSNIDRGIINLLVQPIKADLALSDTSVSLLVGFAFSFFYMLCGLPMARVADAGNRKIILTSALAIWSCATALCGLAQSFWQLFAARGLVGGGESVKGPCSMSMISDIVPRHHMPRAFAIYQLGINAGQGGALIIGGFLIAWLAGMPPIELPAGIVIKEWHAVFLLCGFPGLLLALLMLLTIKEPVRRGRKVRGSVPIKDVVKFFGSNWRIYLPLLLSIAIASIESFGMIVWRPAFFERSFGWGPEVVGPLLGTMMLISTPIGLGIGAFIAEHFVRQGRNDAMLRVVFLSHVVALPLAIAMPLMPNPWMAFGMGFLASVAASMAAPGQNSAFQIITPNEMRGQINAVYLFSISVIGGGLGPTAIALITDFVFEDENMLRYAMALFVAIVGPIGVLLTWLAMKPYGEAVRRFDLESPG
ncbi:MFS transporter [Sphingobium nicotianae]|uniref:MFS transporter n=1 Tax=Sphingobium nicotianae TaxID=2782607 RepID=A0A9X1D7V0_9SPHN|nr:MFS transporter [Sphingobium nicotianae]MBT2185402.1 MFS transporter [Sphingobium nicotianae]